MAKPNKYNGPYKIGDVIGFKKDMYITTKAPDNPLYQVYGFRKIVIKADTPCQIKSINPSFMSVLIMNPVDPSVTQAEFRTMESRMYYMGEMGKVLYGKI
jgi:hypothetical protein